MLKATLLSGDEIVTYSSGTGAAINSVGMQYHASSSAYEGSYIKTTVDRWAEENIPNGLIEARLITSEELFDYLGYGIGQMCSSGNCWEIKTKTDSTPSWVYNLHSYWTMTPDDDSVSNVIVVYDRLASFEVTVPSQDYPSVRPVIVLSKSALSS